MKIVIIGASHAGTHAATLLRQQTQDNEIILLSDEVSVPYQRPPLSKSFLIGQQTEDQFQLKSTTAFEEMNIDLRCNCHVTKIDVNNKLLHTSTGKIHFDKLILATGGKPRTLQIDGIKKSDIHYLRDLQDAKSLQQRLSQCKNICLIGGGYIGLETAASLRQLGKQVVVVEAADRILTRGVARQMSSFYQAYHEQQGVNFLIEQHIIKAEKLGGKIHVLTNRGESFNTDLIIAGIGILPNIDLAEQAGLNCDNGIEVNRDCQTTAPDIYAIGDCANYPNSRYQARMRIESVQNATEQARIATNHILGNPYKEQELPWFWSDQYQLKLKMAGLSQNHDEIVIRGSLQKAKFSCFYLLENRVIAVDCVNQAGEFMAAKILITSKNKINKQLLSNVSISMKEIIILCQ
jgi:3-phenylpropionate/trans-cinnamate dioxygenase ferredoxin reductase subunit